MENLRPTLLTIVGLVTAVAVGCGSSSGGTPTTTNDGGGPPLVDAGSDAAPDASGPDTRQEPPIVVPAADIIVDTLAGSSTAGSAEGVGAAAQFDNPVGVFVTPSGDLFVTEYDGSRLRKVPLAGSTSTLTTTLVEPFALVATDDAVYVQTDQDENGNKGDDTGTIWKVPLAGGTPEVLIGGLGRPRGLALLLDGRLVVSDRTRNTLSILDVGTKTLTPLAGSGTPGFVNGRGTAARFNNPYGAAVLPDGSILVAESWNHVIRRVTLEGDVSTFAGEGLPGMKDDADKLKARFDNPGDVAVDAAGNVFVSDGGNHRIRRISTDGVVETVAGSGSRGFADGIGASATFYAMEQIDVAADGKTIYVADGNGGNNEPFHRIRRVTVP